MYRQESKQQLLKERGAIKMTMMDKKELMFEETSSIVGGHAVGPVSGTGPLQETGPLKYETGPLGYVDYPYQKKNTAVAYPY